MEVLVTVTITGIGLFAFMTTNTSRMRTDQAVRAKRDLVNEQVPAAVIALRLTKDLERADRFVVVGTGISTRTPTGTVGAGDILLRIPNCPTTPPDPTCFDTATNYRWIQYRRDSTTREIVFYRDAFNCTDQLRLGRGSAGGQIDTLTFQYRALADPPPGGDPDPAIFSASSYGGDLNAIEFTFEWDNQLPGAAHRNRVFRGLVPSRAIPYSDVNAGAGGLGDSGTSLAPSTTVGAPPPGC